MTEDKKSKAVVTSEHEFGHEEWYALWYGCPSCGEGIALAKCFKFCPFCGVELEWDVTDA